MEGTMARANNRSKTVRSARRTERSSWGPTALQREYRTVLDSAKARAQVIVDSDGTTLVVQLKDDADLHAGLADRVAQLGRFLSVARANAGREPREWAQQTDFPYLASFDAEEVEEFSRELLAYTLDAAQRGTLENLEGNLRAWQSSAAIYENPTLLAELTVDLDLNELVEVHPPSEQQVEAAAG
jgi:hypothetical protein